MYTISIIRHRTAKDSTPHLLLAPDLSVICRDDKFIQISALWNPLPVTPILDNTKVLIELFYESRFDQHVIKIVFYVLADPNLKIIINVHILFHSLKGHLHQLVLLLELSLRHDDLRQLTLEGLLIFVGF